MEFELSEINKSTVGINSEVNLSSQAGAQIASLALLHDGFCGRLCDF